jgi:hypothetical protein
MYPSSKCLLVASSGVGRPWFSLGLGAPPTAFQGTLSSCCPASPLSEVPGTAVLPQKTGQPYPDCPHPAASWILTSQLFWSGSSEEGLRTASFSSGWSTTPCRFACSGKIHDGPHFSIWAAHHWPFPSHRKRNLGDVCRITLCPLLWPFQIWKSGFAFCCQPLGITPG